MINTGMILILFLVDRTITLSCFPIQAIHLDLKKPIRHECGVYKSTPDKKQFPYQVFFFSPGPGCFDGMRNQEKPPKISEFLFPINRILIQKFGLFFLAPAFFK
jgi:hypothetical protein